MIALIIALVVLALFLVLGYICFYIACVRVYTISDKPAGPWRQYADRIEDCRVWMRENMSEKVTITSYDGLKLVGLFIPAENAKGTIIVMHGYRSRANMDFVPEVQFMNNYGYNLLVVMQRSHDESEGKYITFGIKERYDCKSWAEYAAERFGKDKDIFLSGISMGASTVLMASGLDLPKNVRGIIADCGFTSPKKIITKVVKRAIPLPTAPVVLGIGIFTKLIAGFGLSEYSTIDAMKKNELPILFIHGDADELIPIEMTYENYHACTSEKELLVIKGANHAVSYLYDTEKCQRTIKEFITKNTKG